MAKERAHHMIVRKLLDMPDNTIERNELIEFLKTTRYESTAYSHAMIYVADTRKYLGAVLTYKKELGGRHVTHIKLANACMFNRETATKKPIAIDFSSFVNGSALDGAADVVTINATEYADVTESVSERSPMLLLTYENATVTMTHPRAAGNCNSVITPDVIFLPDMTKKPAKKRNNMKKAA